MIHGIDISSYQPNVDFIKVKESGTDFVIIRAGFGTTKDNMFENHYRNAKAVGLNAGAYIYSYARNKTQAIEEAKAFLSWLSGKQFEYPVYIDVEDSSLRSLSREELTENVITFCDTVQASGYYVGIYSNLNWFENRLILSEISRFDKWLADWAERPALDNSFGGLWQYGLTTVSGIQYQIDGDISYRDYPDTIKKAKLNGFDREVPGAVPITIDLDGKTYSGTVKEIT